MTTARPFRGFRFPAEVILRAVRRYPRFPVGYRDPELMPADRGVEVDRVTLYRRVRRLAPELEKRMKRDGELRRFTRHRRGRRLNNLIERDHRRIKRPTRPMLGFERFPTARRTPAGAEATAMLAKGRVCAVSGNDMPARRTFVAGLFGIAA